MSIVLDLIQKIVLHNAYELTCQAAEQVFNKCRQMDNSQMLTWLPLKQEVTSLSDREEEDLCPKVEKINIRTPIPAKAIGFDTLPAEPPLSKPKPVKYVKRDAPSLHLGPIDPPQCSSMRICRDSYFS